MKDKMLDICSRQLNSYMSDMFCKMKPHTMAMECTKDYKKFPIYTIYRQLMNKTSHHFNE